MATAVDTVIAEVKGIGKDLGGRIKALEDRTTKSESEMKKWAETPNTRSTPTDVKSVEGRWGFKSFNHFLDEVRQSGIQKRISDSIQKSFSSEQVIKAAQGMGELVGSDGGFLVPPEFSMKIFERVYSPDSLIEKTDKYTIGGNSIVFPRNAESSRATGSRYGGVQAYWRQEGSAGTKSKPTFGRLTLNLHKLFCLAAVTDELLADTNQVTEQYLVKVFSEEIRFMTDAAVFGGTGAGQPQGFANATSRVTVDKESGQLLKTIVPQNIVKMWARLWAGCRSNAVWLINQDTESQLHLMTLGIGTAGIVVYMPPGGLSGSQYATLIGRPVIATEFNETLGTEGDIVLVDLSQVVSASKGGIESANSMHLYFDTDEMAFRTTFRMDSQPWWATALTPFKGTDTQSYCVTLATRA